MEIATSSMFAGVVSLLLLAVLLIVGIIVMATRRREHGRAAVIGIMGCVVLLLGVLFDVARGFLMQMLTDLLNIGPAIIITSVISLIFNAVGVGLLIWAVVARRQPAPPPAPGWQQPYPPQPPYGQG